MPCLQCQAVYKPLLDMAAKAELRMRGAKDLHEFMQQQRLRDDCLKLAEIVNRGNEN